MGADPEAGRGGTQRLVKACGTGAEAGASRDGVQLRGPGLATRSSHVRLSGVGLAHTTLQRLETHSEPPPPTAQGPEGSRGRS